MWRPMLLKGHFWPEIYIRILKFAISDTSPRCRHLANVECRMLNVGRKLKELRSDGKIDSNRFGRPNRFESIRSAESIWLIIDSVSYRLLYYTLYYSIV